LLKLIPVFFILEFLELVSIELVQAKLRPILLCPLGPQKFLPLSLFFQLLSPSLGPKPLLAFLETHACSSSLLLPHYKLLVTLLDVFQILLFLLLFGSTLFLSYSLLLLLLFDLCLSLSEEIFGHAAILTLEPV